MKTRQSRRDFIKNSSTLLAGASVMSLSDLASFKKGDNIGLQLYSVRDQVKKEPLETLKALAKMGYKQLEHAAYIYPEAYTQRKLYGYSAKELRKILDDLGMTMPSGHVVFGKRHWDAASNDMVDQWKWVVEDALTLGQKYVISASFDFDKTKLDECRKGFDVYNKVGEKCAKAGIRFGFHNHHQEFEQKFDGEYLYDIMLKELDLKYVCQQLDICNLTMAHVDPMTWLKKFPKHFELMHVKDRDKTKPESCLLGDGSLNMKEILDFARKNTSIKYWVLEQESYGDKTPLECVKIDLDRLKANYKFG